MNQDYEEYTFPMLIQDLKKKYGIIGYIFVFFGAIFFDTPMLALLAVPAFITGTILLVVYYEKMLRKYNKIGLLSIIVICVILAYISIQYNQYLVLVSRGENEKLSLVVWIKVGAIALINLILSYLVYLGLKYRENLNKRDIIPLWLPILLLMPLTIVWKQFAYWAGYWMGG